MHPIFTMTGRLHPLLVHLPIGFLLMALLLRWIPGAGGPRFAHLSVAVPFVLLLGVFSALLSCITGLLLSSAGEYDSGTVIFHMWMGIATTLIAALWYSQIRGGQTGSLVRYTPILLLGLIFLTGHLGGSLTHGADYLSGAYSASDDQAPGLLRKPIADVQQAVVYTEIIQPILSVKCYNCHGPNRQKGKLRMDQPALLMQGGKNGPVVVAGKAGESEMIKRVVLPLEDEHHMSPKGKPQLTEHERALLSWWIGTGASFTSKVKELAQTAAISPILVSLQGAPAQESGGEISDWPAEPVDPADEKSLAALRARGAVVLPVAGNSHYIEVNFINNASVTDRDLLLLLPLRQQLVALKLGHTAITDTALQTIASCRQLIRLQLDHTAITDKGLVALAGLSHLKYINLVGTVVTAAGVAPLKGLQALKAVYLYQTRVDKTQWPALQTAFKGVRLDSGGYVVPTLPGDTQIVRTPR